MFKNSLLLAFLFISTHQLLAQKGNPRNLYVVKENFVSTVTQMNSSSSIESVDSSPIKASDSSTTQPVFITQQVVAKKRDPRNLYAAKENFVSAVAKLAVSNANESVDLLVNKGENSTNLKKDDNPIKKKATPNTVQQMDSIWLKTGETLTGRIAFNKDSNTFLFSKDTFLNVKLRPSEVTKIIAFPKKREDERLDVVSIENDFYFLESDAKSTIQIYAKRTFKPILDDGPKHYFVQSKYCLVKNNVPYLLNNSKNKDILMALVDDCKKVVDKFKSGQFTEDNFIEAVLQYNRCNK
jgi:hypothetical protein